MGKALILILITFLFIPSYAQKVLNKCHEIEKFGWENSDYWMNFNTKDTSSSVSIQYDSLNVMKSISSRYSNSNFIPYYDSSLILPDFKENGPSIEFYDNYKIKSVKIYYLDIPIGTWIYYFPSGQIERIVNYPKDSLIYSLCKEYSISKRIGSGKNDSLSSLSSLSKIKSLPHGEWVEFYENGNIKVKKQFFMGLATGKWNWYYDNKQPMKSGQFYEKFKIYPCKLDTTIELSSIENQDDIFEDLLINIQPKHGKWKHWDKNGNLILIEEYDKGKLIK